MRELLYVCLFSCVCSCVCELYRERKILRARASDKSFLEEVLKGERRKKKSKSRRNVDNPLPECKISYNIKIQEYFPPLHFVFIEIAKKILQGPSRWVRRLKFGLAGFVLMLANRKNWKTLLERQMNSK